MSGKVTYNKGDIAIAVSYKQEKDPAPKVTASGRGKIAGQIMEIAIQNNIPIKEDTELAQILSLIDVDSIIPLEAYAAMAEILSYIYKVNSGGKT